MKFKRIICLVLILCMIIPLDCFAYSGSVIPNDPITMPKATPVIDGEIETNGVWSYVASMDEATTSDFWAGRGISASADLYFAYDTNGIYFAADITDNDFIVSTGYDTVDGSGSSYPYGFNGDIFAFSFDPLGRFEKSSYQITARYNVGIYSTGATYIYRSQISESNITGLTKSQGRITANGWRFEAYIPWSIIFADAKTAYPGISLTQSRLYASGVTSYASCMYVDRYKNGSKTQTHSRIITVRDITYDKINGCETNGIDAKTYGLSLINGDAPAHSWNDWVIVKEATCTTSGSKKRTCQTCNQIETQVIPATGHSFEDWVIVKEATSTTAGSKTRTCSVCNLTETYEIPPYGENDPIVVAYYNASQVTVDEFTDIDVLNYHPAFISETATSGKDDVITDSYSASLGSFRQRVNAQNPNAKITFTLMVQNLSIFESWFANRQSADLLATKIVKIISDYGFDGFDIDYEYPTSGNKKSQIFVYFMAQMRYKLDRLSDTTKKDYLLSMAVPGTVWSFSLFDMQSLSNYVDYFNIMDYDIDINATYAHHHTSGAQVASDIATYIYYGIPKSKIVVGCGMYSLKWSNVQAGSTHGLNQTGTRDSSNIHYSQLLSEYVNKNGFVRYWDDINKAPYLYNASTKTFISYDDSESVRYKCECVTTNDIGGIMFFDYCTCDGEGLFANVKEWLTGGSSHTHNFVYTSTTNPTCTEDGYFLYTCSCSQTKKEPIKALGHDFGAWTVTKQPTTTEKGTETRKCSRCTVIETRDIPVIEEEISVYTENYNIVIKNAIEPSVVRLAKGTYTTTSEIKNAPGMITYSASRISKMTDDSGTVTIPITTEGSYSLWIRCSQGDLIFNTETGNFTPTLDCNGITLRVSNTSSEIFAIFYGVGNLSTYREVKNNSIFTASSTRISGLLYFDYQVPYDQIPDTGILPITVCVRKTDGSDTILHTEINIDTPSVSQNGLNITLTGLNNIKTIKRVFDTCLTPSEIKSNPSVITYGASVATDGTATLHIPHDGELSVMVQYKNGYAKIFNLTIVKKTPTFKQTGNKIEIGNLFDMYVMRYAKGTYNTIKEVKLAPGSIAMKKANESGIITVSNLKPGEYTFAVQYNEESITVYNVTIE